jgi:hypothetical protein
MAGPSWRVERSYPYRMSLTDVSKIRLKTPVAAEYSPHLVRPPKGFGRKWDCTASDEYEKLNLP